MKKEHSASSSSSSSSSSSRAISGNAQNELSYEELYQKRGSLFKKYEEAVELRQGDITQMASKLLEILQIFQYEPGEKVLIPQPEMKDLVIEGGGVKGFGFLNALAVFEEHGCWNDIKYVAGTSVGALTALLIGLGFTSAEIKQILSNLNIRDFQDPSSNWGILGAIRQGSMYEGEAMRHWISAKIAQVLGIENATFREFEEKRKEDLSFKGIIVYATNYDEPNRPEQAFSFIDTPDYVIADCVYASAAYPGAFKPTTIRKKIISVDEAGETKIEFETIPGRFADGGIVNNWPVDAFNRKVFYHSKYTLLERDGKFINPHVVGLSLKNLESLNEEITPIPPHVKKSKKEVTCHNKSVGRRFLPQSVVDLKNAFVWGYWGVREPQNVDLKQEELYYDRTIQIYDCGVSTLNFCLSPRSSDALLESGLIASRLWFRKFRNPTLSYPAQDYDDRLTPEEEELKSTNYRAFLLQKSQEYFLDFIREIDRQQRYSLEFIQLTNELSGQDKNDFLLERNVRLRFNAHKILQLFEENFKEEEKEKRLSFFAKSFYLSYEAYHNRKKEIKKYEKMRWRYILGDDIVNNIASKINTAPDEAIVLLKGQLSNVISLVKETDQQGKNLLGLAVKKGSVKFVKTFFNILKMELKKCQNQNRLEDNVANAEMAFQNMINQEASPPILNTALELNDDDKMLSTLIEYGAKPISNRLNNNDSPILKSIESCKYSSFKLLVSRIDSIMLKDVIINNDTLLHHILRCRSSKFIRNILRDEGVLSIFKLFDLNFIGSMGCTPVELAASLSKTEKDYKWQLIVSLNESYSNQLLFYKEKAKEKGRKYDDLKKVLSNLETCKVEFIKAFEPNFCLAMLSSLCQSGEHNQLCELACKPEMAQLLIAICEQIWTSKVLRRPFLILLNEKYSDQTPFYRACMAGNIEFFEYILRKIRKINIFDSGPLEEPNPLLAVAKRGDYKTLSALTESIESFLQAVDFLDESPVSKIEHEFGFLSMKSCLFNIIENNRTDILTLLIRTARKPKEKLDYIFDWKEPDMKEDSIVSYPELEYAYKERQDIYRILISHMSDVGKAQRIDQQIKRVILAQRQRIHSVHSAQIPVEVPRSFIPQFEALPVIPISSSNSSSSSTPPTPANPMSDSSGEEENGNKKDSLVV